MATCSATSIGSLIRIHPLEEVFLGQDSREAPRSGESGWIVVRRAVHSDDTNVDRLLEASSSERQVCKYALLCSLIRSSWNCTAETFSSMLPYKTNDHQPSRPWHSEVSSKILNSAFHAIYSATSIEPLMGTPSTETRGTRVRPRPDESVITVGGTRD